MPTPYLEKVAKDTGKSVSEVEDLWSQAKAQAAKEGHTKDYAYITAIFKKMAGVTSSTLKVNSDVKTTSDYESIPPSNLGLLDSKTADPHNFDSQGNPVKPRQLKAYARIVASEDMTRYIKMAADSIEKLRKSDVYRVLMESNGKAVRPKLANWIKVNRPDLADEVDDCLSED